MTDETITNDYVRDPELIKARAADGTIRIMRDENPYKRNSAAHRHFEYMRGGCTVRQYLAKFTDAEHRTARQWLWNAIDAGHVKILGG